MTDRCVTTTYPNGGYCVDCDEQPLIPAVPEHVDQIIDASWDAGANSISIVEAPNYLSWAPSPGTIGEVVGLVPLAPYRDEVRDPANIAAAFYVYIVGAQMYAQAQAYGVNVGVAHNIASSDTLRIEHVGTGATFKINSTVVGRAPLPDGANRAAIAIFRSGDKIATPAFAALTAYDTVGSVDIEGSGGIRASWTRASAIISGRGSVAASFRYGVKISGSGSLSASYTDSYAAITGHGNVRADSIVPPTPTTVLLTGSGSVAAENIDISTSDVAITGSGSVAASWTKSHTTINGSGSISTLGAGDEDVFLLLQSPGAMIMTVGYSRETIDEVAKFTDLAIIQLTNQLLEHLRIAPAPTTYIAASAQLVEHIEFEAQLGLIWKMLVEETIDFAATETISKIAIEAVFERFRLLAGATSSMQFLNLIVETLGTAAALAVITKESITDELAFASTLSTHLSAAEELVDAILFDAVPTYGGRFSAIIDETIMLDDSALPSQMLFEQLSENLGLSLQFKLGDEVFLAWVVNTETKGATLYDNFPFNSFCAFDDRYFACAPDGIYELGADDDNGDAIKMRIRLGLRAYGDGLMTRMPSMYLGFATDGSILIKAYIVERDPATGEAFRSENWYRLDARAGGMEIREGRIKLGRGLSAAYWDFAIENVDGSNVALDAVKLFPMVLERRIRGNDG